MRLRRITLYNKRVNLNKKISRTVVHRWAFAILCELIKSEKKRLEDIVDSRTRYRDRDRYKRKRRKKLYTCGFQKTHITRI
jgi:hypothetical protein